MSTNTATLPWYRMSFLHFFNNYERIIVHWNHCLTQTIFAGFSSPPLVRSYLQPQSNDLNRGTTEGPHRCINDARHKFDMVWLYCSPIPISPMEGGILLVQMIFTCLRCARGRWVSGGGAHSPAGEGVGESQFRRLEKSLALSAYSVQYSVHIRL